MLLHNISCRLFIFFPLSIQTAYCLCLSCNVDILLSHWTSSATNPFSQGGILFVPWYYKAMCFRKHPGYVSLLEPTIINSTNSEKHSLSLFGLSPSPSVRRGVILPFANNCYSLPAFIYFYFKAMLWFDLLKQLFMWWVNPFYSLTNYADCDYDFQSVVFA